MHQTPSLQCRPLSSSSYLFVRAAVIAAGALSFRRSIHSATTSRSPTPRFSTLAKTPSATLVTMYGGGSGVSVPARMQPTSAMIFLHGLGDTGNGWAPAFPLQGVNHVQTILPTADEQHVSMNMGYRMPSWFDIRGLDEDAPDDEMGIMSSVQRVDRIVDEQLRNGIPEHRIVVGGFSQGGAVALTYGLRTERKLAGIVALSSWLPLASKYPMQLSTASKDVEIFMGHGTADQVVSFRFGEKSASILQNWERRVLFKSYPGLTHSASPPELDDVRNFINRVLPRD